MGICSSDRDWRNAVATPTFRGGSETLRREGNKFFAAKPSEINWDPSYHSTNHNVRGIIATDVAVPDFEIVEPTRNVWAGCTHVVRSVEAPNRYFLVALVEDGSVWQG
jgi:hypothetical protein